MSSSFETILLDDAETGVALCTFNRPVVQNALNLDMVEEIRAVLNALSNRDEVPMLIFTGAGGKAFLAGADIGELRNRGRIDALRRINTALFREIEAYPMPTIAAVRGWALGGGTELAMACDLRVAGEGARFGLPEVGLGIIPGSGGTYRLPKLVGLGRARELIFTGRIIDAQEALSIGLVNRVVADDAVLDCARELTAKIAENSAIAVRFAKQSINLFGEASTDAAQTLEASRHPAPDS